MTVYEYVTLLKRRSNILASVKEYTKSGAVEKARAKNNMATQLTAEITAAEETECVQDYLDKKKRLARLKQMKGSWEYYKKDTTDIVRQMNELSDNIKALETTVPQSKPTYPPISVGVVETLPALQIVTPEADPIYYIINLAWTFVTDSIQDPVVEFMKMSNHISIEETPNTITWKFPYDTIEERAQVKALQMCAAHLLEVLKKSHEQWKSDAEIFGKMQKY